MKALSEYDPYIGKNTILRHEDSVIREGIMCGVSDRGELILKANRHIVQVQSGDISFLG
jgi:biotin-(acetyl-CoA carboxylase) ligase